jgi:uncharacterized protein with NRDE domain
MCIALIAHQAHQAYSLIIAANRDEHHARPTAPASWWQDDDILAGRDLTAGGTWFGIRRNGRIALLTNYRDGPAREPGQRSRGELVVAALRGTHAPQRTLSDMLTSAENYSGFNLIAGTPSQLYCASNRNWVVQRIGTGVAGLSNHLLDSPWPKVERAKERMRELLSEPVIEPEALFDLLNDRSQAADHELPDTGIGIERERFLSPPFIVGETYGTRSSTVLLVDQIGGVVFIERAFDRMGEPVSDARFTFSIAHAPHTA